MNKSHSTGFNRFKKIQPAFFNYDYSERLQHEPINIFYVEPTRIRNEEYYYYEKVLRQSKIDLVSHNYTMFMNVVGWIFIEDEWDEGSFNFTLQTLYLKNYKRSIVKWCEAIAVKNAKKQGFNFDSVKADFYSRYSRYLGAF